MKKSIYFTYFFHALCFISMIAGQLSKNGSMISISWMADIGGAFLLPLAIAVLALLTALSDEQRVVRHYPSAASAIGGVGLVRAVLFFFISGKTGVLAAMTYLLISFLLLTLWFLIFEVSLNFMNKGTKINRKFGKRK